MQNRLVWRLIKGGGQQATPQGDAGPGQVRIAGLVVVCPPFHLRTGIGGLRRVGDSALRHLPNRRLGHVQWGMPRPPRHHGGVGQQQRDQDRVAVVGQSAEQTQDNHLAGPGVAADPDLGVEPAGTSLAAADQGDDPAGMLTAGVVGRLDRFLGLSLVHDDYQGQHPAQCHGANVVPQLDQVLVHCGRGGAGKINDHGFLQVRPSRAIMASAHCGPHPPAG